LIALSFMRIDPFSRLSNSSSYMALANSHWDGGVLVIDTVGVKTDAFTSVDRFGTPQSEVMHVVERYRLIDSALATAQIDNTRPARAPLAVEAESRVTILIQV
jgi:hypothetical protein